MLQKSAVLYRSNSMEPRSNVGLGIISVKLQMLLSLFSMLCSLHLSVESCVAELAYPCLAWEDVAVYCGKLIFFCCRKSWALLIKVKVPACIYIAPSRETSKALRHGSHSVTCKLHHACLSLVSVHQMALPLTCDSICLIAAYYSSVDPERKEGWVGLVGWPTADGLPT